MKMQRTTAPALTTPKQEADSRKRNEELVLLRMIISEARHFRVPDREEGQQPPRKFGVRCVPGSDGDDGPR
jgi:hypothetical protein